MHGIDRRSQWHSIARLGHLCNLLTITSKVQILSLLSTVIKNDQSDNMREGLIDPVYAGSVMWLKEQLRRSHTFPGTKSRRL